MLLSDLRLKFARELIGHWLDIRGGAVVPLEEAIDPREVVRCFDNIGIIDLARPAQVIFELAGASVSRRFDRDIRHVNWVDLVPTILGDTGKRAREQIRSVPCGYYHKFTGAGDGSVTVTAETLVLPLRHRVAGVPTAVIGITHEFDGSGGNPPAGWLHPLTHVEQYVHELVDIGAGAPTDGLP